MGVAGQMLFDIEDIYVLVHKREEADFSFACGGRLWDGFVTVTEGECTFSSEDTPPTVLSRGDTVLLRKGERYTVTAREPCAYYTSAFDFAAASAATLGRLPRLVRLTSLQQKALGQMTATWQRKSDDAYMFCKIQLLTLYFEILKEAEHAVLPEAGDAVHLAVRFIHDNFRRNFTGAEVAAYASSSTSHLRAKFAERMGMSIVEYRDTLRIKMAKELLASGLFSVKEAAYELGFCDVYYFTRFFARYVGTTPGKFKAGR